MRTKIRETVEPSAMTHELPQSLADTRVSPLMRDFLTWLRTAPRTYAEAMEAWRTSCPRLSIWEDALADGFVPVESEPRTPIAQATVRLTPHGQAALDGHRLERP